jgi:hypothetical protein
MAAPTVRGKAVKDFDKLMGAGKKKPQPTKRGQAVKDFDRLMGVGPKPQPKPSVLQTKPWLNPEEEQGVESRSEGFYTPPEMQQQIQDVQQPQPEGNWVTQGMREQLAAQPVPEQQMAPIHPEQGQRGLGSLFSSRTLGGGF